MADDPPPLLNSSPTIADWPMFGLVDDVREPLRLALDAGEPAVLATLYAVAGGAPRPPGSQMLFTADAVAGFLSGGCLEADLAAHAREVMRDGRPRRLVYGEGGLFPDIRLVCGGRVEILMEGVAVGDPAAARLIALADQRRPALWVSDGVGRACWAEDERRPLLDPVLDRAADGLQAARGARCVPLEGGAAVALRFRPKRRLVTVGADPTALAIAELAARSGFESWLVRPKGPVEPPPLAGVRYDRRPVEAAFDAIGLDRWTHVAIATHEMETDEAALLAALRSEAAYVGVLGARRRLPERLARLRAAGIPEARLSELKAPIGLDLGGKAPFEIAIAVLAEVIAEDLRALA